jgi:hypothetical protein
VFEGGRDLPVPLSEHAPDHRAVPSLRTAENGKFALGELGELRLRESGEDKLLRYMPLSRAATGRDECEQPDRQ